MLMVFDVVTGSFSLSGAEMNCGANAQPARNVRIAGAASAVLGKSLIRLSMFSMLGAFDGARFGVFQRTGDGLQSGFAQSL